MVAQGSFRRSQMGETERSLPGLLSRYQWYHSIRVSNGISTTTAKREYQDIWNLNFRMMDSVDFKGRRVLDVGCRDGLFSFEAEKRGAREVIGVDNDLSLGATEFLIPFFKSKVKMHKMNLYDLTPDAFGTFDVILLFGVLYHLRYPVWGLKRLVDCLADGGLLLIESAMIADSKLQNPELMYCPFEDSPYERTSCTFFNQKGLNTTMRSLNCRFIDCQSVSGPSVGDQQKGLLATVRRSLRTFKPGLKNSISTTRQSFIYRKAMSLQDTFTNDYWNGVHQHHTKYGG